MKATNQNNQCTAWTLSPLEGSPLILIVMSTLSFTYPPGSISFLHNQNEKKRAKNMAQKKGFLEVDTVLCTS